MNFTNKRASINRLKEEYAKYGDLIIGCDFDETLFDLHELGYDNTNTIALIKRCQLAGLTTCLWTACTDEWSLVYKKELTKGMGLEFKFFNDSPVLNNSRKPHFSILLDDRAGLGEAFAILETTLNELKL